MTRLNQKWHMIASKTSLDVGIGVILLVLFSPVISIVSNF